MQSVAELPQRFSVPGVTVEPGQGGLTRVTVETAIAAGHVYLHGAHVTHYQPRGRGPVLFVSGESLFAAGKAIRGGVPVIFPWFGAKADDPKAPQHGFVRNVPWKLRGITAGPDGAVAVTFAFGPSAETRKVWPHEFELLYAITFGAALEMSLQVRNAGTTPFRYEEALHTYLAVADVRKATIEGLGGREFIDKVDGFRRKTQPPGPFTLDGETDRVYLNTPDTVVVNDRNATEPAGGVRMLSVEKQGSASTIVWNPWIAKAKAMADFGDDEWPRMLCVETANAAENAVTLQPGKTHTMRAAVRAV
jgi:glucose-6-phosphate 1-epimerase